MKKNLFFLAALGAIALTSCTNDEFIGENGPNQTQNDEGAILFGFGVQNSTRGDIVGNAAANLLGSGFYVAGTKGSEHETYASEKLVFDNYLVHYAINTAGTTESNTANWEYVGITPGTGDYTKWVKLSSLDRQTIKYWDYSEAQYDFLAFSTGSKNAVNKTTFSGAGCLESDEIGVTAMNYGDALDGGATAYTFYIPTTEGLQNTYITDVIKVAKADYGKEVKLTFKNLGSKIRLALYETVPGYSVKDVKFYTVNKADDAVDDLAGVHGTTATLISANDTYGFSTMGTAVVSFPKLGSNNSSNGNYRKASVSVTPQAPAGDPVLTQTFGELDYKTAKEGSEDGGVKYLGRNIIGATYAGKEAAGYYQVVFPVTNSKPLTLRVDYTLVATDGSNEEIKVYGAKAVVPSTYTVWQPNYAYTYIFKITDNTNGWTSTDHTKAGLFPITFDAVVAEVKDASGEQTTVTTVATPTITTYQQGHEHASKDEYSKSTLTDKDIYVQVMDNSTVPATLVADLNGTTPTDGTARSLLYSLSDNNATEAEVMDALENRTSELATANVTGRNGLTLTKDATNIDATVTQILNGVDDKPITQIEGVNITAGQVVKLDISGLTAATTYAYVYDYSDAAKTTKSFYQPKTVAVDDVIGDGVKYITLEKLGTIAATTTGSEAANDAYIYFSKTTTDGVNYTYSYYSVDGKEGNLPAGLLKVAKASDLLSGNGSSTKVAAGDFVFDIYKRNTGKYAVKVIKIVA